MMKLRLAVIVGASLLTSAGWAEDKLNTITQNFTCGTASITLEHFTFVDEPYAGVTFCSIRTEDADGIWYDEIFDSPSLQDCVDAVVGICEDEYNRPPGLAASGEGNCGSYYGTC